MRYLLDTNLVSDLVRNPQGKVAQRIRKVGEGEVCTSIIVAAELRYGAAKKGSPRLSSQLEVVLGVLRFCLSRHRLTRHTDCCGHGLSRLARQSAPTICLSRPKRLRLVTPSSAITKRSLLEWTTFYARIGCARPESALRGQFDEQCLQGNKHSLARVPILLSAGQSPCWKILSISDMDNASVSGQ
jgi:hypothetical protein